MTGGLKALGILGGGAVVAAMVASSPSESPSTVQSNPAPIVEQTKPSTSPTPVKVTPSLPTANVEKTAPTSKPVSNCHPGYSGCLKMNAGDYDCAGGSGNGPNYTGPVKVYGSDPFGLDRDGDGLGCE